MKAWQWALLGCVVGFVAAGLVGLVGIGGHQSAAEAATLSQVVRERAAVAERYADQVDQLARFRDSLDNLERRDPVKVRSIAARYVAAHVNQAPTAPRGGLKAPDVPPVRFDTATTSPDAILAALVVMDSGCRVSLDSARRAAVIERAQVSRDSVAFDHLAPLVRPWTVSVLVAADARALRPGVEVARNYGRFTFGGAAMVRPDGTSPGVQARAGFSF